MRGAAVVLWAYASAASAQLSGTASVVSDYRYRGITLSDRKPALQAGLNYDGAEGWYVGAFGSTVRLAPSAHNGVQGIVFGGTAWRLSSGLTLEAGGDYSMFSGATNYNYGEVYVGAMTDAVTARVYYSPSYFGQDSNAVYAELNASQPFAGTLRLLAHVGFLSARPAGYSAPPRQNVVDGRVGLGADFEGFHLELAWVGVSATDATYRSPNTVVLMLSFAF